MGSFNPPHKGHIKLVRYLLKKRIVDRVLIVPTLNYWDKNDLVDIKDRINMLSFYANDNIIIDGKHNNLIYTYELVKEIEKLYPNSKLSIIIGADNVVNLDKWKNYQELIKYHFIIMNRNNIDIHKYLDKMNGNFTIISDYPYLDISSTIIRKEKNGKYLDKKVLNYIRDNNLYDWNNNLFSNIDLIHTTKLGIERIKKNLNLYNVDIVNYLKNIIQDRSCIITKRGKNYYCEIDNLIITINSYNYCIITAHIK